MNKLTVLSGLVLLFLLPVIATRSQTLDRSVLKAFSPSVVARVYDLARAVPLRSAQQYSVARRYAYQDSLLAAWLMEGRPAAETDSLARSAQQFLFGVLDKGQMITYQRGKDDGFAAIAADGEFQYIKEVYHPEASYYPAVQNMLNAKYGFVYQQYLLWNGDKDHAQKAIANTSKVNDLYNLYSLLYTNRYANEYLERLRSFRPIPDSTLQNIRRSFYSRVGVDKLANWNQAIEEATQYYLPDTALFSRLHRTQFERQAFELSRADSYNLVYLHRVTRDAYDSIYPLVLKKNYARTVLEYTYSLYQTRLGDSLQRKVARYYDSAIEASLLRDGSLQPVTQFAIALKYKDKLQLSPELVETLLQDAMYLAAQKDSILHKDPFAAIDFGPYEAQQLSGLLTEDQYEMVLTYKNKTLAMADAKADWAEMELRGLTGGFFKDQTIEDIFRYYVRKTNAWCRFANDKIKQWAALRVIGDSKPAALKVLDPIRWNGETERATNNLKLKW